MESNFSTPQANCSEAHAFYALVKELFSEVQSLCLSLDWALKRLIPLDSCARHDQPVDDETWTMLAKGHPRSTLYMRALRGLRASRAALEQANQTVQGQFRGESKNKVEGLMARQVATAQHLLEVMEELAAIELETSRLPYQIRKTELSPLAGSASDVADGLVHLYRTADKNVVDADLLQALLCQQQSALQVRATLGRLRDNPSQKITDKLQDCAAKMKAVRQGLLLIMRDVADRSEMRFVTRSGKIVGFKQTMLAYQYGLAA
jgi:hypothetical protein